MSLSVADKSKVRGVDPAFAIMFTAVVIAVAASMTLRLAVGGMSPSKARGNEAAAVEHRATPIQTPTPSE